jgi:hypothetical protein
MDRCGANDKGALSRCNFCGSAQRLLCYPADVPGVTWYGCAHCVGLIRNENWDDLIERIVAAFAAQQPIPEDEEVVFRQELENQLKELNTFGLHPI